MMDSNSTKSVRHDGFKLRQSGGRRTVANIYAGRWRPVVSPDLCQTLAVQITGLVLDWPSGRLVGLIPEIGRPDV